MRQRYLLLVSLVLMWLLALTPLAQAATAYKVGSAGNDVKVLQESLTKLDYGVGPIDGIFGSKTQAGVQEFQRDFGLKPDGIVGPLTAQALAQALQRQATTEGIINSASSLLGVPYLWGGTTPQGFDCSGYTQYVFKANGIDLPRTSREQALIGQPIEFNSLAPGDLVFFSFVPDNQISHEGIYLGNGQFISATTRKGVAIYSFTPYWLNAYKGAKRVY